MNKAQRRVAVKLFEKRCQALAKDMTEFVSIPYTYSAQGVSKTTTTTVFNVNLSQRHPGSDLWTITVEVDDVNIFGNLSGRSKSKPAPKYIGIILEFGHPEVINLNDVHILKKFRKKGYLSSLSSRWFPLFVKHGFLYMDIPAAQGEGPPWYKKHWQMGKSNGLNYFYSSSSNKVMIQGDRVYLRSTKTGPKKYIRFQRVGTPVKLSKRQIRSLVKTKKKPTAAKKLLPPPPLPPLPPSPILPPPLLPSSIRPEDLKEIHALQSVLLLKKKKLEGKWLCISHASFYSNRCLSTLIGWPQNRLTHVIRMLRSLDSKDLAGIFPRTRVSLRPRKFKGKNGKTISIFQTKHGLNHVNICSRCDWWCIGTRSVYDTPGNDPEFRHKEVISNRFSLAHQYATSTSTTATKTAKASKNNESKRSHKKPYPSSASSLSPSSTVNFTGDQHDNSSNSNSNGNPQVPGRPPSPIHFNLSPGQHQPQPIPIAIAIPPISVGTPAAAPTCKSLQEILLNEISKINTAATQNDREQLEVVALESIKTVYNALHEASNSTTTPKYNRISQNILTQRGRSTRIQGLKNNFEILANVHKEPNSLDAAIAVASRLAFELGTVDGRVLSRQLTQIQVRESKQTKVGIDIAVSIRANLWQSTIQYNHIAILLKNVFGGRQILPPLHHVIQYEKSDKVLPTLSFPPHPFVHSIHPNAVQIVEQDFTHDAGNKQYKTKTGLDLFNTKHPKQISTEHDWKTKARDGTHWDTTKRTDVPNFCGFSFHAVPMVHKLLAGIAREVEINLMLYMEACYDITEAEDIAKKLKFYKMVVVISRGIDGMGDTGEKQGVIGGGDHQLRACVKILRVQLIPLNLATAKDLNTRNLFKCCPECGNSGLSKEIQAEKPHKIYKTGCNNCGRVTLFRQLQGNSSKITPDFAIASGNENNATVYREFFGHCEREWMAVVAASVTITFNLLQLTVPIEVDVINGMFDVKALAGIAGVSCFGPASQCMGGRSKKDAKEKCGTCNLLTMNERIQHGLNYEKYASYKKDGEHTKRGCTDPQWKRRRCSYFITSKPMSTFYFAMDASHCRIAMGKFALEVLYHEVASVQIWNRGSMNSDQRTLLDSTETIVDTFIEQKLHRAIKMMFDGNNSRHILATENQKMLVTLIPDWERKFAFVQFLTGIRFCLSNVSESNPEPGSWIGYKDRAVEFANWVNEGPFSYIGWGNYFHQMIEHVEEHQIRLGGLLGMASAESQEAGNKEGRKVMRTKARAGAAKHRDIVIARWLRCNRLLAKAWEENRLGPHKVADTTLQPASKLKRCDFYYN